MLNTVIKSAAWTAATLIVRDSYPQIKKACSGLYDSVCDLLDLTPIKLKSNTTTMVKPKQPRNQLTEYQYNVIMSAYELNNELSKKDKITQQELCDRLNADLELSYSRSGYCHLWQGRVIPEFNNGHK